jgi:hypothetical protein
MIPSVPTIKPVRFRGIRRPAAAPAASAAIQYNGVAITYNGTPIQYN